MQRTWALALLAGVALTFATAGDADAHKKRRSHRSTRYYSQRSYRPVRVNQQPYYSSYGWRSVPSRWNDGLAPRYRTSRRGIHRSYGGRHRESWVADRNWQDCPPYASARE